MPAKVTPFSRHLFLYGFPYPAKSLYLHLIQILIIFMYAKIKT